MFSAILVLSFSLNIKICNTTFDFWQVQWYAYYHMSAKKHCFLVFKILVILTKFATYFVVVIKFNWFSDTTILIDLQIWWESCIFFVLNFMLDFVCWYMAIQVEHECSNLPPSKFDNSLLCFRFGLLYNKTWSQCFVVLCVLIYMCLLYIFN
jgi:hypothetical protein